MPHGVPTSDQHYAVHVDVCDADLDFCQCAGSGPLFSNNVHVSFHFDICTSYLKNSYVLHCKNSIPLALESHRCPEI